MSRALLAVALGLLLAGPLAAQVVTVVAASSRPTVTVAAPGGGSYSVTTGTTPGDSRTFDPSGPRLNASGQVAFTARLAGAGGDSGLFRTGAGAAGVVRLALEGAEASPAIGDYGELRRGGAALALNDAGQVALVNDTSNFTALLRFEADGGPTLLVEDGTTAPGEPTAAGNFAGVNGGPIRLNLAGQVGFTASVDGSAGDGLFRAGGTPAALALNGANAPPAGSGVQFEGFSGGLSRLSTAGRAAFGATAGGADGVYTSDGASAARVAQVGTAAPGGLGNYDNFTLTDGAPAGNAAGQVAFKATTDGSRSLVARYSVNGSGQVVGGTVLAANGAIAPGTGGTFGGFGPVMGLNAGGRAVFMGEAGGGDRNRGFFTADGATVTAVVVGGQDTPLAGVTFGPDSSDGSYLPEAAIRINDAGGVAFWARLTGTGVTTGNDSSLWYRAANGDLLLLAREDQAVPVGPGDSRVLDQLPQTFDLSDAGVAFLARFKDGSEGVLFVDFAPVPEPAAGLAAGAVALAGLGWTRRRLWPQTGKM